MIAANPGSRVLDVVLDDGTVLVEDGVVLDAKATIAAASIVAKVARDSLMAELAGQHPGYGWERNAGYGTREHQDGLARLGVTMHHRRSFRPIAALLATM